MEFEKELTKFFDPDSSDDEWSIVLRHVEDTTQDCWYMEKRLGYRDAELGEIVVPRNKATFTTDLTSVPQLFTWLVPRTGTHLAAALVHDALTPPFSEPGLPDWQTPDVPITQQQADRVFRSAMADLGTPFLRRWMVWSAVSVPTAWKLSKVRAGLGYAGLLLIAVLGWFATLDLFDQGSWLPWMGDARWTTELLLGGLFALLVPLPLALLWPKGTRTAGAIVGIALAALFHVSIAVAGVTFAYQFAEYRWKLWANPKRGWKILATVLAFGLVVLTYWMFRRYNARYD
jgi:hypothetical protein